MGFPLPAQFEFGQFGGSAMATSSWAGVHARPVKPVPGRGAEEARGEPDADARGRGSLRPFRGARARYPLAGTNWRDAEFRQ